MNKRMVIIAGIIFLALLLFLYLALSTRLVTVNPENANKNIGSVEEAGKSPVDQEKLEASYRAYVKSTITDFEDIIKPYIETEETADPAGADTATSSMEKTAVCGIDDCIDKLSRLKISLMDTTVPQGYQNLHIDLVKLFSSARTLLESREDNVKNENIALLEKIKSDHPWIIE
jgi:hypothetical protein